MRRVDNYLTRKACVVWPRSIVSVTDDGIWLLERPDEEVVILHDGYAPERKRFAAARESLAQLIAHESSADG